ncbi:hypothetical protein AGMMS4956_17110 [Bacteroidia bacterium]|nr:hypothetical protein AGMMS4956_17110 [Bacteroidia bacterium]
MSIFADLFFNFYQKAMAVKIRLSRHGKKAHAFYHIVVADSRAPRDGKLIEKLGTYNPNTNPATIELNFESALKWLNQGAQPSDTARAILSYKGVLYKKHLDGGVKKGAFTAEVADQKLAAWLQEKSIKIQAKIDALMKEKQDKSKNRFSAEQKVKEAKSEVVAQKRKALEEAAAKAAKPAAAEAAAPAAEEQPATEQPAAEQPAAEQPAAEQPAAEQPAAQE